MNRKPHALYCDDPSLTKQSFKEECDINTILERARKNGTDLTQLINTRVMQYGDFTNVDYKTAMDTVARANSMFMELHAEIRARFKNDPAELLAFMNDPKNYDEAVALGVITPRKKSKTVGGDNTPTPAGPARPPAQPAQPAPSGSPLPGDGGKAQ